MRQPDPEGKKRPADDLQMVAESVGLPQRVVNRPNGSTYEQVVEFAADGVSATVRVWRGCCHRARCRRAPPLPLSGGSANSARLFVESNAAVGRPVLNGYVTDAGTLGVPGAARERDAGWRGRRARPSRTARKGRLTTPSWRPSRTCRFPDRLGLEGMIRGRHGHLGGVRRGGGRRPTERRRHAERVAWTSLRMAAGSE